MKKNRDLYSPTFYWLTKTIAGWMARWQQNVRHYCPPEVRALRGPFIVCSNHVGLWDPFILCKPYHNGIRYITADAAFRRPAKARVLGWLGSIPKTKGVRDSDTIRRMLAVFARNQVIGIFPEGDRSYDGRTLPLNDATGKLLKKMGLPVVACVHKGTAFTHPRWSRKPNRGRIEYHHRILFRPEDLGRLDGEEIQRELERALAHDDTEWQKQARVAYRGGHRAECIEHPVFICPVCGRYSTIRSRGDDFSCSHCSGHWHITRYGEFLRIDSPLVTPACLRDWLDWQETRLLENVRACPPEGEVFADDGCTLYTGYKAQPLVAGGTGRVALTRSGVSFQPGQGEALSFAREEIRGITVQEGEIIEFYCGENCYQLQFAGFVSAYKWARGITAVQRAAGPPA